jgi:SAM-dependent methyltransferase
MTPTATRILAIKARARQFWSHLLHRPVSSPAVKVEAPDPKTVNRLDEETNSSMEFTEDPSARDDFARQLSALLERPEPEQCTCGCCGSFVRVPELEHLVSCCCFTGITLTRVRCHNCKVIMGPMQLIQASEAEIGALYQSLYQFYREGFSTPFQEKTFYLLNPSRSGRYLNYACGEWDGGLRRLREMKWDVFGYEPFIVNQRSQLADTSFDGLFSHNFIEHLQSPEAFFRDCWGFLKPGGVMIHSTPCYDYLYHVAPLHLYFFCDSSIQRLAERIGFDFIQRWTTDRNVPGSEYIACSFQKPNQQE